MLIIFSGLPGTGKTTLASGLARRTGGVWLRIDSIEQAMRGSTLGNRPLEDAGYRAAYAVAEDNLRLGRTVIADSVNPISLTRDAWLDVARRAARPGVEVEVVCSDRDEHRRRVESRTPDIPGLRLPTWQEVLDREYHAWDRDRIVVDTAEVSVAHCLDRLIGRLPSLPAG